MDAKLSPSDRPAKVQAVTYVKKASKEIKIKGITNFPAASAATATGERSMSMESQASRKKNSKAAGPEEWMEWCSENKVLVGQTIEITHYEIEATRRHFVTLKFQPSDEGVHPKTLADSFHRAEVFATFNEALLFCQKLGKSSDSLVTFSDLLNAANSSSIFKRNKVTSYMKFVASSSLFKHMTAASQALLSSHQQPPTTSQIKASSSSERFQQTRSNSIGNTPEPTNSSSMLSTLVNGASDMLSNVFTVKSTPGGSISLTLVPRQRKTTYQRQESGDTFRNYSLRRSGSRGAPPSPSNKNKAGNPTTITEGTITEESSVTNPENSVPLPKELKKQDSLEQIAHPAVKLKTAAIKIFASNRLKNGNRVAIEAENNKS